MDSESKVNDLLPTIHDALALAIRHCLQSTQQAENNSINHQQRHRALNNRDTRGNGDGFKSDPFQEFLVTGSLRLSKPASLRPDR